jgi:rsbT co-antagonist protein RsbR
MGCAVGFDGRIIAVNRALERALGTSAEELIGEAVIDLIHPDDRPATLDLMRAVIASAEGAAPIRASDDRFENRLRKKDGSYLRVTWSAAPDPARRRFFASARPLTDLDVTVRRLRALADAFPHFIGVSERGEKVLYINPAGRSMLGLRPEDPLPATPRESLTPRAIAILESEVIPALVRHRVWKGETELLRRDGEVIPAERLVVGLPDESGRITVTASLVRDLREEKAAEETLTRFKALAHSTSDLVATASITGGATYVNPAGMAMLGRAGEDFTALTLRDVVTRAWRQRFRDEIFPTVLERGIWSGEAELLRRDGSLIPVSQVLLLIRNERGEAHSFGTIARDRTEQKALEEALERALRELSTPILRIGKGVLALPIIGRLDEARAAQMTEALLHAIVATRSRVAVLDMTGAHAGADDLTTIRLLLSTASAVTLLGSRCFLCGISPEAASRIAAASPSLPHARPFATLEDALRAAAALADR